MRSRNKPGERVDRRIVYLVTSSVSSRLMTGQLAYLQDAGFRVTVGTGLADSSDPQGGFDAGVDVVDLGFRRPVAPVDDLCSLVKTARLLRRIRPEHVNVSTPKAAMVGMLAAWALRVPHRVYVVRGLRYETMTGRRRSFYKSVERLVMNGAHDVVFNSASLRDLAVTDGLVSAGSGRILAGGSGNGVDVALFDQADDNGRQLVDARSPTLGFVGRLTADKGLTELVDVFQRVAAERPGARLLVVGQFEDDDPVDDATRRFIEVDERVDHLGWTDDVRAAYERIDILVFLSKREGLPNVPMEAQASGVPVVGFAATGTVDAVRNGRHGALAPMGDVEVLHAQISEMLDVPGRYENASREGREFVVEQFDRQRVWESLLDVYESAAR